MVKNLPANEGDTRGMGSIPGSGRSPGGGHGNPLQYSCLASPMDRVACQATVHGVAKSRTRLKHARTSSRPAVHSLPWAGGWQLLLPVCTQHCLLPYV